MLQRLPNTPGLVAGDRGRRRRTAWSVAEMRRCAVGCRRNFSQRGASTKEQLKRRDESAQCDRIGRARPAGAVGREFVDGLRFGRGVIRLHLDPRQPAVARCPALAPRRTEASSAPSATTDPLRRLRADDTPSAVPRTASRDRYPIPKTAQRHTDDGQYPHLVKPVDHDELLRVVGSARPRVSP